MKRKTQRVTREGFTLLELLVVVGIIGLLVGIMVPTLSWVRKRTTSTVCQSNLKSLAPAFRAYALANRDILPEAANMPSLEISDLPSLPEALAGYAPAGAFRCPSDTTVTFFEKEGSSYEYNTDLGGQMLDQLRRGDNSTWMLCDYVPFHGKSAFDENAINYLFVNGDVDSTNDVTED